ncbi:MAG TPA: Lrp/AsnC family transcriptional regulator [Firmicutes bacterium]|nr:Lrp/AsnC family transcriptional regulator [Bacillota bacterium]
MRVDETDLRIIALLQQDGRMPSTEIADKLGITDVTVRKRIARLRDEGIIQITAVANPIEIGLSIPVIIKISVDIKRIDEVIEKICKLDEVWYVAVTTGDSELDIEAHLKDLDELNKLLFEKIYPIEGVQSTHTSVVLKYAKRTYNWLKVI